MSAPCRHPLRSPAAAFVVGLLAVLVALGVAEALVAPRALAHAQLVSSIPTDGASVDAPPAQAELVFNEEINPAFAQIVVADAADIAHSMTPVVAGPKVTSPLPDGLPEGKVSVRYRVVSKDGHPISGAVTFTLTSGKDPGAAGAAATGAAAAPKGAPAGQESSGAAGGSGWIYGLTAFAALVLAGVGALILRWERQGRR